MSHRHDLDSPVRRVRSTAAVVVLAGMVITVMAIVGAAPSEAQRRFMTARGASVTIDYGVLESLGPVRTVPSVLRPSMPRPRYPMGSAATRRLPAGRVGAARPRIVLTPPGSRAKARRITKRSLPARRQISKSRRILRSPPLLPAKLVAKPAPAGNSAVPGKAPRKLVARRAVPPPSIPPPPISSTPLEPAPPVPAILDRRRPPGTADRVAPPPPPPSSAQRSVAAIAPQKAAPTPPQSAALTPARKGFGVGRSYRLAFTSGLSKLDGASTALLDEIAGGAKADRSIRLKLLAYAGAAGETASQSRRLSLSRALAVRSYLIDKGVRSVQFEVQAKGKKLDGGPPDRVDVIVTKR